MPPGDTTFYTDPDSFYQSVPDSARQLIDSLIGSMQLPPSKSNEAHYLFSEWQMLLFILFAFFLVFIYYNGLSFFFPKMKKKIQVRKATELLLEKGHQYTEWLDKFNPYYKSLSKELKERFLLRTAEFMHSKEFIFHSLQYEEHIPVLISGSAVQLTFGLNNYLMDYFSVIHVIGKEYVLEYDQDTYYGHVSRTGIYVAWNHFLKGYAKYDDSINVGLHEMAHAVSYDVFLGQQDRHDREFRKRLEDFSEEGRPVFRALKRGDSHILDDYAATNFDEFWAVCIETFFENPEQLKRNEPDLYISICELLNQDPSTPGKIIDMQMAGLET